MGKLALVAKITHVPSMYLSELPGPRHGTRKDAIDGHVEIGRRCREAGVPLLLMNPTCNLRDCPPFKSEHRADLTPAELTEFEARWTAAQAKYRDDLPGAVVLLRQAAAIDGQYAALLTQQGKVLADVRVLCAMNSLYLDFWENLQEKFLAHLNRYLIADEVEIAARSQEYAILSLQGPASQAVLQKVTGAGADLPTLSKQHAMVAIEGAAACVVYDSHTGEAGYDLIAPIASLPAIAAKLTDIGKQFAVSWVGEDALNVLRLEAGIPRYGVDFGEDNLLLEVGIDNAVSFTKGCYLGQEVVERIRSRGHVNRKLCGLLIDGAQAVDPGDIVQMESREVGRITSSVISPRLQRPIALGYLHRDFCAPDTAVAIGRSRRHATVAALPFLQSS